MLYKMPSCMCVCLCVCSVCVYVVCELVCLCVRALCTCVPAMVFLRPFFTEIASVLVAKFPCFSMMSNIILNGLVSPASSGPEICFNSSVTLLVSLGGARISLWSSVLMMFAVIKYFKRFSMSVIELQNLK